MEPTITSLAKSILQKKQDEFEVESKKIHTERKQKEQAILESFLITFHDYIPLLKNDGVEISAHFKGTWEHRGSYILFKKGNKSLKMDYNSFLSYRYEYTPLDQVGSKVYGTWPKEDFVLFIYNGLLKEEDCPGNLPSTYSEL